MQMLNIPGSHNVAIGQEAGVSIRNRNGDPVPLIGGITSRNLFSGMLSRPANHGGIPNTLWLVTSLALIAAGLWGIL